MNFFIDFFFVKLHLLCIQDVNISKYCCHVSKFCMLREFGYNVHITYDCHFNPSVDFQSKAGKLGNCVISSGSSSC